MASEQEAGRLRIRPVLTVLAAEGLPLREYDRIAEVFATKLGNSYAATECPFLSYSCQHHWLHVNADWVVIEPVDAHYRPVAPGTQSHTVLVTSLERKLSRLGVSPEELEGFRKGADPNAASRSAVTAPFAGVVTEVHAAPGELINPERELFTVADLSRVWLQADVYQKDIAKIRVGQDAQVTVDAYPGETFTGRVTHISDVLDAGTRTAKVRCEVANRDGRLKHQMFATLALPVSALRESIVIPATSVQDIDGVPTVFVRIDEEHFETRPVRIGSAFSGSVEVAEGLKTGERVVTEGALMLKSKLKLRVEEEEGEKK
jgi:cobalt-zinc-cadmium efflux system membrane fusion protein